MRSKELAIAGALALALAFTSGFARAADDTVTGKNAVLATVVFCSKDIGAGVMASCAMLIDTSGNKISPMPKDGGSVGILPLTTGGCTPFALASAASTNATSVKASTGMLCGGRVINTTVTTEYLRLYNLTTAPTCSSATGFVGTIPIPPSGGGAGTPVDFGPFGAAFSTGIAICITGGPTSTDNTAAVTGVYATLGFK